MTIATRRMLLLPYTEAFESDFLMLNCCTKNRAHLNGPLTVAEGRKLFHHILNDEHIYALAVLDNYNREYIGHIQVVWECQQGDLLFLFDKAYWGKGFGFEALHSCLPKICRRFSFKQIKASISQIDIASAKLLDKLGFVRQEEHSVVLSPLVEYVFICLNDD